jgi:TusA-related sulfurtransferase
LYYGIDMRRGQSLHKIIIMWGDLLAESEKHLLDCVGLYCPAPVMNTRTEIDGLEAGALLEVVADDAAAWEDIPRWARRAGHILIEAWKDGDELHFLIKKKV